MLWLTPKLKQYVAVSAEWGIGRSYMATRKVYHVTEGRHGNWKGSLVGASRASVAGPTKAEVVAKTIELAKNAPLGQVVIHKGQSHGNLIQTEHTYGKDPERSPG